MKEGAKATNEKRENVFAGTMTAIGGIAGVAGGPVGVTAGAILGAVIGKGIGKMFNSRINKKIDKLWFQNKFYKGF